MKRAAAAVALALLLAAAAPARPLGDAAFRDLLAARIEVLEAGATIRAIDARTLDVTLANGTNARVSIDNAYAQYQADPSRLDELIERFARLSRYTADDEAARVAVDRLVPIVRPADLPAQLPPVLKVFTRPLAGDLILVLALDAPDSLRYATTGDLDALRLTENAAWDAATRNVKRRMGKLTLAAPPHAGSDQSVTFIGAASGLAPSMLTYSEACGPAKPDGLNGAAFLLLDRENLLFGTEADVKARRAFRIAAKRMIDGGRSVSRTPITCQGGRWQVVAVP